jgi:hypothetical protein
MADAAAKAQPPAPPRPARRGPRGRQVLMVTLILTAVVIFLFPAFVAFRYSAPSQRMEYVRQPWKGWSFALAAVEVPSRSELKTSGMALRKADWVFKGTSVDPREVQLLFMPADQPFTFTHQIDGRAVTSTITPTYKFVWQVQGAVETISESGDTILGMLDYRNGHLLYDIRDDLQPAQLVPEPTASAVATPAP